MHHLLQTSSLFSCIAVPLNEFFIIVYKLSEIMLWLVCYLYNVPIASLDHYVPVKTSFFTFLRLLFARLEKLLK